MEATARTLFVRSQSFRDEDDLPHVLIPKLEVELATLATEHKEPAAFREMSLVQPKLNGSGLAWIKTNFRQRHGVGAVIELDSVGVANQIRARRALAVLRARR